MDTNSFGGNWFWRFTWNVIGCTNLFLLSFCYLLKEKEYEGRGVNETPLSKFNPNIHSQMITRAP